MHKFKASKKWDTRFLEMALLVSSWSKDPGTKVGCVIVDDRRILATGYNGLPHGVADLSERFENREWKLAVTIHAEVNAILNAGKHGARTANSTLYVTWPPCSNCASAIIQAGITRVVYPLFEEVPERWRDSFHLGKSLLEESNIEITELCLPQITNSLQ